MSSFWFAGFSRDSAKKRRSHVDSKRSSRTIEREVVDGKEPEKKPSHDEVRRRRLAYYTATPVERRRMSAAATAKAKSKSTASVTAKSVTTSEQRHQRRKGKSASKGGSGSSLRNSNRPTSRSSKSGRPLSEGEHRTEDYVYAPRSVVLDPIQEEQNSDTESPRESFPRSERRRSSKRYSSSTVFDDEVTPEDSISQVGLHPRPERRRQDAYSRPSLKRSSTTSSRLERVREEPELRRSATSKRSVRPESSVGSTARRHSTSSIPQVPSVVECLTCGSDDVPTKNAAKLSCGHRMCHDCIRRIFDLSVKDPQHMPPRCCTDDPIPVKYVDILFDDKFKAKWTRKYKEYNTRDRLYCATPRCGNWIKPIHVHTERGRKYATCGRCKTKVCGLCGHKMHKSTECPKDPEIAKILKQAKEEGWQRCFNCNAMVERKEGCNHMTCRCKAEFCIVCAKEWKTCDCPWFNYDNAGNPPGAFNPDLLNGWNIPEPIHILYRQVFQAAADAIPPPPAPPARAGAGRANRARPPPEVTYQQEMDQRREQERADADLARRLQFASIWDDEDGERPRRRNGGDELLGLGNAARHFLNDDFVQNAANVVMNAFGDANMGRRGERASGRRRRARPAANQNDGEPGLPPNFLGDESVLGVGPSRRSTR